ncbi:hypothetical protein NEISICOT_02868 [Neisseria sicca ATCC 29256]|uniref:Uncharacterized protein n=1 Tax=Neisseria sicca ATCC 29256 TaxID=547045 RepID=C6M8J5_NEISI|nr:hypothetical protein [Neisseria sicca]EET43389.1 hypothetical protein NEISICOT_02868 [Neisseria sicca ATCC 29256]
MPTTKRRLKISDDVFYMGHKGRLKTTPFMMKRFSSAETAFRFHKSKIQ